MLTTNATGYDICARAAKYVGILAAGEVLAAEDAADILDIANGMLDSLTMDRLFVFASTFNTFALTANVQSYSIGPGATFSTTRPNKIEEANIVITSQTPNVRRPLYIMDDSDWMSISIRPLPTPSIPTALYYSRDFPNGTLYFWPTPQSGLSVELELWTPLAQFTDLTTAFSFPPGYYELLTQNLALRLCTPEWGLDSPPGAIFALAQQSRERIASLNSDPPPQLRTDAGLQGTRQGNNGAGQQRANVKNLAPQWYR